MNLKDALTVYATGIEAREFSQGKRKKLAKSGAAEPDGSYPIVNREDLENAKRAIGRGGNKASDRRHINERAKALGAKPIGAADGSDVDAWGTSKGAYEGHQERGSMGRRRGGGFGMRRGGFGGMMRGVPKLRLSVDKKKKRGMKAYDATSQYHGPNSDMGPAKSLDPL